MPGDALLHRPFHHRMMPGNYRIEWNLDLSLVMRLDVGGTGSHAGDRDGRAAPRGSLDLMAPVGGPPLLASGLLAALSTAVAVSAITVGADAGDRLASDSATKF